MQGQGHSGNLPRVPARPPHERHRLRRVTERSWRKKGITTVIESWVDVQADIDAINQGATMREGEEFVVAGRRYHVKPDGRTYPVSGRGFHQLARRSYIALGVYNQLGLTAAAEAQLNRMQIPVEDRVPARVAWQADRMRGG